MEAPAGRVDLHWKPFKFKQGLDERLLTDEKCEMLFSAKYDGDFIFAFDNIADYEIIKEKLKMIRRHTTRNNIKFYVLVGFEGTDALDIMKAFMRIELLGKYRCLPYIMRFRGEKTEPWKESKYSGMYIQLARWCNQPKFFKNLSFREFCEKTQKSRKSEKVCAAMKALEIFEHDYPALATTFFDKHFYKEEI